MLTIQYELQMHHLDHTHSITWLKLSFVAHYLEAITCLLQEDKTGKKIVKPILSAYIWVHACVCTDTYINTHTYILMYSVVALEFTALPMIVKCFVKNLRHCVQSYSWTIIKSKGYFFMVFISTTFVLILSFEGPFNLSTRVSLKIPGFGKPGFPICDLS